MNFAERYRYDALEAQERRHDAEGNTLAFGGAKLEYWPNPDAGREHLPPWGRLARCAACGRLWQSHFIALAKPEAFTARPDGEEDLVDPSVCLCTYYKEGVPSYMEETVP